MKTSNIKVAVSVIGSVIKFRKDVLKRSDGSSEYYKLIWGLLRNESISELWLMQTSDWEKLTDEQRLDIDPRGILKTIYIDYNIKILTKRDSIDGKALPRTSEQSEQYKILWDRISHLEQPDFALCFTSQGMLNTNIPGIIPMSRNPEQMRSVLDMALRYSAPIIHWLNMSNIPWFTIHTDPRYINNKQSWYDIKNIPRAGIGQYNMESIITHYDTYPNPSEGTIIKSKMQVKYSGIEKLNILGEDIIDANENKDIKFAIVAMQSKLSAQKVDRRFEDLKEWILDQPGSDSYNIYGRWDDDIITGYDQFKGYKSMCEIDEIFKRTRYTFIIPIRPNWVTSKYVEMIRVGVIPFMHPSYDTQYSVLPNDHYIRVSTPQELFEKIEYLEQNHDARISLVKELQDMFLSGTRDGSILSTIINKSLTEANINIRL